MQWLEECSGKSNDSSKSGYHYVRNQKTKQIEFVNFPQAKLILLLKDYLLFSNWKKRLKGKTFPINEDGKSGRDGCCQQLVSSHYNWAESVLFSKTKSFFVFSFVFSLRLCGRSINRSGVQLTTQWRWIKISNCVEFSIRPITLYAASALRLQFQSLTIIIIFLRLVVTPDIPHTPTW